MSPVDPRRIEAAAKAFRGLTMDGRALPPDRIITERLVAAADAVAPAVSVPEEVRQLFSEWQKAYAAWEADKSYATASCRDSAKAAFNGVAGQWAQLLLSQEPAR